jgi:hypothetical protein
MRFLHTNISRTIFVTKILIFEIAYFFNLAHACLMYNLILFETALYKMKMKSTFGALKNLSLTQSFFVLFPSNVVKKTISLFGNPTFKNFRSRSQGLGG